jgi:hypothetical protein
MPGNGQWLDENITHGKMIVKHLVTAVSRLEIGVNEGHYYIHEPVSTKDFVRGYPD